MPPVNLLRNRDDASEFGLEPESLLELKEKAVGAKDVAYCTYLFGSYGYLVFWCSLSHSRTGLLMDKFSFAC